MKKLLTACGALAATSALLLAGCSAAPSESDSLEGQTLTILSSQTDSQPSHVALQLAIDTFEKQTGAKVNLVTSAFDQIVSQTEAATLAGEEADLVNINPVDKVRNWVADGAAVPINDYLDEWNVRSLINDGALTQWTVDGDIIGFPYESFQWPMWFNMDLLKQAGVTSKPTTMSELEDAVAALRAAGITPFAVGGGDWTGQDLLQRFIQSYVPESDYPSVFTDGNYCSNADAMAGIGELIKLRDAGMFQDNAQGLKYEDMTTAFYTGQVAMMVSGSWSFAATPEELQPNVEFGGIPVPDTGAVNTRPAFAVGYTSSGYVVTPNGAKKPELVKQFMNVMYSPEVVQSFISAGGFVPAVAAVPALPEDANALLVRSSAQIADTDRFLPTDPWVPAAVVGPFPQGSSVAYTAGSTSEDVCAAIEAVYASAG